MQELVAEAKIEDFSTEVQKNSSTRSLVLLIITSSIMAGLIFHFRILPELNNLLTAFFIVIAVETSIFLSVEKLRRN